MLKCKKYKPKRNIRQTHHKISEPASIRCPFCGEAGSTYHEYPGAEFTMAAV